MKPAAIQPTFESWQAAARALLAAGVPPADVEWREVPDASPAESAPAGTFRVPRQFLDVARQAATATNVTKWTVLYEILWRLVHERDRKSVV